MGVCAVVWGEVKGVCSELRGYRLVHTSICDENSS